MSDAGCTSIDDSAGIHAIVGIIGITKSLASTITRIDERTVHIGDTNWIAYVPPTASWRFVNVTLSCTGNVTHELPPNDTKIIRLLSHGQLAILVTTVAGVVALLFTLLTRSSNKLPPGDRHSLHAMNASVLTLEYSSFRFSFVSLLGARQFDQSIRHFWCLYGSCTIDFWMSL